MLCTRLAPSHCCNYYIYFYCAINLQGRSYTSGHFVPIASAEVYVRFALKILLLVTLALPTQQARGIDYALTGVAGYGIGILQTETSANGSGAVYGGRFDLLFPFHGSSQLLLGLNASYAQLSIYDAGVASTANFFGPGVNSGIVFGKNSKFEVSGTYIFDPQTIVGNSTIASINGETYKHSAVILLDSDSAFEARAGYISEVTTGQFTKHERMRVGFLLNYTSQSVTKRTIKVGTNDATVGPTQTISEAVDFSLSIFSLQLILGMGF
jgi:hypothetical protein